jgi:HNH endonuclease
MPLATSRLDGSRNMVATNVPDSALFELQQIGGNRRRKVYLCPACQTPFSRRANECGCSPACRLFIRFWRYVTKTETCWLWTGAKVTGTGYGSIVMGDRSAYMAHRLSYEWHVGPIPDGYVIDHLCGVRNCVRPEHLEAVTTRENLRRGNGICALNKRKTHCKRGHLLDGANIYVLPQGGRACRQCKREWDADRRQGRRAALFEAGWVDARTIRITHCPRGHLFDDANTSWDKTKTRRRCRTCAAARQRGYVACKRAIPGEQLLLFVPVQEGPWLRVPPLRR